MKTREYKSTVNTYATVREHPCGVLVECEDGNRARVCPTVGAAVEWLAEEFSVAWMRVNRYQD